MGEPIGAAPCVTWSWSIAPETEPEWVKFMELVRPLAGRTYEPEFTIGPKEKEWARQQWTALRLPESKPRSDYSSVEIRTARERLWPSSQWGELAERLQENDSLSLVLIMPPKSCSLAAAPASTAIYSEISHRFKLPPSVFLTAMWCGSPPFCRAWIFSCASTAGCSISRWLARCDAGLVFRYGPRRAGSPRSLDAGPAPHG